MSESNRERESSLAYAGWPVALASSLGVFVSFASLLVYTFGVFLKPIAREFAWSRQGVSLAFGIAAMGVAACSPVIGHLLDRYGVRRVILPCMTVFGATFASIALMTPSIWRLYAVFALLGIVGNGTAQLAFSRAIASWFVRSRGMALAVLMGGGAIGSIVLPPAAQALIDRFGWRGAVFTLGAMVLVLGLPVVAWFVREKPSAEGRKRSEAAGVPVSAGLRSRAFWILVVVLFLNSIGQNGAITHLSALLTDRGIAASGAALAISAMGIASLGGRFITGWLVDRFFAPRVAFALLAGAALGVYILSNAHSLAAGIAGAMLIGLGMGCEADVTPYLLSRYFGLRSFSTLYGLTWTAYALAGAIGPVLMGRAFDATKSYEALLAQVSIGTFAGACLMLWLPRYDVAGWLQENTGPPARLTSSSTTPSACMTSITRR